ncbi:MAG: hypothetical protein M3253_06995, partial [Chloroflexota bacterium]|nr:hypothetical protein [Chloroflexota bacterium]
RAACTESGRDFGQLTRSAMTGVLVGRDDKDLRQRVSALMRVVGADEEVDADSWLAERRERWVLGTPEQALERVRALEDAGVQRLMLQNFLPRDLEMVRLLGETLIG